MSVSTKLLQARVDIEAVIDQVHPDGDLHRLLQRAKTNVTEARGQVTEEARRARVVAAQLDGERR